MVAAERGSLRNIALASALKKYEWSERKAGHDDGFSLAELAQLGGGTAMELTLAELRSMIESTAPVLVHLKAPQPARMLERHRNALAVAVPWLSFNLGHYHDREEARW